MKKQISLLSIILMCFCITNIKASPPLNKNIDSLKSLLSKTKNAYQYTDILNQLSRLERDRENGDRRLSLVYAKNAISISNEMNYEKGKADALLNIGITERELGNYDTALSNLEELIKISGKNRYIQIQGDAYDNVGHIFLAKNNKEQALKYHLLALALRKKINDDYGYGNSCDNIATIYYLQGNYLLATDYYKKSLSIFEKLKDDSRVALSAGNVSFMQTNINNYSEALKYNDIALKKYEKLDNKEGIVWMNRVIGGIYSKTENHKKALEYFHKSLKISEKLKRYDEAAEAYSSIGHYYSEHNKPGNALKYYFKYLDIGKKIKDSAILGRANYNIARMKYVQGNMEEALQYSKKAIDIADKFPFETSYKFASIGLIGSIFYKQGNYELAKEYTEKALEYHKMGGEKTHLKRDYETLSSINEKMGNYKAALENKKLSVIYQDSLKQDDITKTVMKYEFDKKEANIKNRQKEEIKNKNRISNIIYGILGVIILSIVFILITLRLRNKKLSAEKQNLELKRREAELAKETETFKSRFLSNISHEFRTPLTLINGHLEILKKDGNPKDKRRFDEMEYSGKRLLQLINQLLDLSKIEKDTYRLYFKKGNLLNEAQNYIQAFYSLAEQRNINLTREITESAKDKFYQRDFAYSSETLASVFNNLISNALKHTPSGGNVHCKIDFRENKFYFSVSDTGTGIPEKDLPHIFDRFYQVATKEKPIYEGSGIGLAIVKELVLLHKGGVSAENNATGGCTFRVWVSEGETISGSENPVISSPAIVPNAKISAEENNIDDEEKPQILVVEDQKELRKFVVENLGNQYRFLEAENGKQGTELALEHLPDIVISDVMMPEMNGLQLCQTLKENDITSHIQIILLTAKSDQTDKIEGLETGADDYLTKPFSISELALRVMNRINLQNNLRKRFAGNTIPVIEDVPGLNQRDRNFLEKLDRIIRENIEKEFSVTDLASEIGLSSSQLTRKLKIITGQTPANFIKNIQMEFALQMLKKGDTVSETAWKIGFSEPGYFTKVFKKHFGFLPSEKDKLKGNKS